MIYVFGHNFPYTDIDSVTSAYALSEILNKLGRPAYAVVLHDKAIQERDRYVLEKIPGFSFPVLVEEAFLGAGNMAIVDHNDPKESYGRFGIKSLPVFCFDHREDSGCISDGITEKRILQVGACATNILAFAKESGVKLSKMASTALAFGIVSDTKGLMSNKTTSYDKEAFRYLCDKGLPQYSSRELILEACFGGNDILNMAAEDVTKCSLKEYENGMMGASAMEVVSDHYKSRIGDVRAAFLDSSYKRFCCIFYDLKDACTHCYWFDRESQEVNHEVREGVISRKNIMIDFGK